MPAIVTFEKDSAIQIVSKLDNSLAFFGLDDELIQVRESNL